MTLPGLDLRGDPSRGDATDHVLVDLPTARQALSRLGMRITGERSVLVLDVGAKTVEFARFARRLAAAGVDVDLVYLATRGRSRR